MGRRDGSSLGQVKGGVRQEDAWEGLSTGAGDPWELWVGVVVQPHQCHGQSQSLCSSSTWRCPAGTSLAHGGSDLV